MIARGIEYDTNTTLLICGVWYILCSSYAGNLIRCCGVLVRQRLMRVIVTNPGNVAAERERKKERKKRNIK